MWNRRLIEVSIEAVVTNLKKGKVLSEIVLADMEIDLMERLFS